MSAIIAYLSQIDPNYLLLVATGAVTIGRWVVHKINGDKQASLQDTLWPIIEGLVIKLARDPFVVETVRSKLTNGAYEALERVGIKRSPLVEGIVNGLVDRGVTEVRKRVEQREAMAALPGQLEAIAKSAEAVRDALKPKGTVPALLDGLPGDVVRICLAPGCGLPVGHSGDHAPVAEPPPDAP